MKLLRKLTDLLWPRALQCLCCDTVTEGSLLCGECASQLNRLRLPERDGRVRSVWAYSGAASSLILGLKDGCVADCAQVLADGMAENIRKMALPPETVLTWVTMPRSRLRMRGIDHGRILCSEVARRTGMRMECLLERREGHTQRGLTGDQRRWNLIGAFSCGKRIGSPVLLIDDVLTTGATAQECTKALLHSGASAVYVLTAAAVLREDLME